MIVFSVGGLGGPPRDGHRGKGPRDDRDCSHIACRVNRRRAASPTGTRLADHADIVIDLCTPVGDAMVTIDGLTSPVGPGSTLAYAAVVNEIKVQTAEILVEVAQDAAGHHQPHGRRAGGSGPAVQRHMPIMRRLWPELCRLEFRALSLHRSKDPCLMDELWEEVDHTGCCST